MTILIAAAAAEFVAIALLVVRLDKFRASIAHQKFYLEAHLAKARAARLDYVKIDAASLAKAFHLDGRTLRRASELRPGKRQPHPATLTPAKRRKLGGAL